MNKLYLSEYSIIIIHNNTFLLTIESKLKCYFNVICILIFCNYSPGKKCVDQVDLWSWPTNALFQKVSSAVGRLINAIELQEWGCKTRPVRPIDQIKYLWVRFEWKNISIYYDENMYG